MCAPRRKRQPAPPPPPPDPAPAPEAPWAQGPPDYGNTIQSTMSLPNSGLGTIESVQPSDKSAEAPVLGNPLGSESQRVKKEKARLTIAA